MSEKANKSSPIPAFVIVASIVILIGAGGFLFAASQEAHDSFCASCHTQPESTFFERSTANPPTDLASLHASKNTLCINCHSGSGIFGRIGAEMLGARNAVKWYTGTAIQPAVLSVPIGDQNCLKCHQAITTRGFSPQEQITMPGGVTGGREGEGRNNHWHEFLSRWQSTSASAGTCVSCHAGHSLNGAAQTGFMAAQNVEITCDGCHQVLREGEGG
jgi:nitrate/TMAO reductase-like tetraheme cytochrome c subunit